MTNVRIVTTFHEGGYVAYGRQMLASTLKHWPEDVKIIVFPENLDVKGLAEHPRITVFPLERIHWLYDFKKRNAQIPKHCGKVDSHSYNFRFDAVRFAHKVAAINSAILMENWADVVIWLDADTFTHSPVDVEALVAMLGDNTLAWLDRDMLYPECGCVLFNMHHKKIYDLISRFYGVYYTDEIFNLQEWHDSFVLEWLVKTNHIPVASLSGDAKNTSHPFINGPLGAWMDHMKGPRKIVGKSHRRDLVKPRTEEYWK